MRIAITKCYSCICNACTKYRCPYAHKRCSTCNHLQFKRIYDCDFFENVHTAPRRYQIKHKSKAVHSDINVKLDYIIASLGLAEPTLDIGGTYAVVYKGMEIFRGSLKDSSDYMKRMQREFTQPLKLKKLAIHI